MSTKIESGWLIADANKLPFKIEGNISTLIVHGLWPRIEIKGKPDSWTPVVKKKVCLVDIEISNQSREDDIYIKYLTINSSSGFTHNILDGLDDDVPEKYVYYNKAAFGSEWLDPMVKKRAIIAYSPLNRGEYVSTLHLRTTDKYNFEINFDPSLSSKSDLNQSKGKSNYSDEAFFIDKINKIENHEVRGYAFRLFLTGKKTNKDSDHIIEEILSFLKQNDQMTDEIQDYFQKIKEEQVIHEIKYERESIPTKIKDQVWRRDQGVCAECGSKEKLEFDHIIPISKGGANSYRNIQLLCEPCNRRKSAKIG